VRSRKRTVGAQRGIEEKTTTPSLSIRSDFARTTVTNSALSDRNSAWWSSTTCTAWRRLVRRAVGMALNPECVSGPSGRVGPKTAPGCRAALKSWILRIASSFLSFQNAVLGHQVLILQQQFLVDQSSNVGQKPRPCSGVRPQRPS